MNLKDTVKLALAASAFAAVATVASADSIPIKIGLIAELTGPFSATGEYVKKSVEAYAEVANANGGLAGHPIELTVIDNQSKADVAVAGLRRLANDDEVHVVICCSTSPIGIALKPLSAQLEIPVIAAGQASEIVTPIEQAKWIFRAQVSQKNSLAVQLQKLKEMGLTKVGYIGVNNTYGTVPGKLIETMAPELGLTVTGQQFFEPTATDVKAQLALVNATSPDAIVVWAVGPAATLVSRNAAELGVTAKIFQSPGAANRHFLSDGGAAVEGNYVQSTFAMVKLSELSQDNPAYPTVKAYTEAWMNKFNETGDTYGSSYWDAMNFLKMALDVRKPDLSDLEGARAAIRDGVENDVKGYQGLAGVYNMSPEDHSGLGTDGAGVLEVRNGAFVPAAKPD